MLVFSAEKLTESARRIFAAAGAPEDIAEMVARSLVESNLAGHDSHGVIRVPAYVQQIRAGRLAPAGRPSVIRETTTTAVVAGNWGFGQLAAFYATDLAIRKAQESQTATIGCVQCNHVGRLGEYAEIVARAGLLAMATVGGFAGSGAVAPFGGAGRALGTNPISFGVPADQHPPVIVDFATSMVAEGKLQVARAKHSAIPEGWILDKEGRPSTDAEDFYAGGMLLPFGGHKGYALSLVAEILGGSLAGVEAYRDERQGAGFFIWVVDPSAFRPLADFDASVDRLLDKVKAVPPAEGFSEVLAPGEPEIRSRSRRAVEGVPVAEDTWERLRATAAELGTELT